MPCVYRLLCCNKLIIIYLLIIVEKKAVSCCLGYIHKSGITHITHLSVLCLVNCSVSIGGHHLIFQSIGEKRDHFGTVKKILSWNIENRDAE